MMKLNQVFLASLLLLSAAPVMASAHPNLKNTPCIQGMGTCSADIGSTITAGKATYNDMDWTDHGAGVIKVGNPYTCVITLNDISKGASLTITSDLYGQVYGSGITVTSAGPNSFTVKSLYSNPKHPDIGYLGFFVDGTNLGPNDQVDFTCTPNA